MFALYDCPPQMHVYFCILSSTVKGILYCRLQFKKLASHWSREPTNIFHPFYPSNSTTNLPYLGRAVSRTQARLQLQPLPAIPLQWWECKLEVKTVPSLLWPPCPMAQPSLYLQPTFPLPTLHKLCLDCSLSDTPLATLTGQFLLNLWRQTFSLPSSVEPHGLWPS